MCRQTNNNEWEYIADHRREIVYDTETGCPTGITELSEHADNITTVPPSTPFDAWNGSEWVTDVAAQRNADVAAADAIKQSLIDVAIQLVSVLQLKLQVSTR
ncbi:tail fiber assembly protein [Citrobacter youngae]|uniref:tail fiber assembly protein n=1 Tax=Citrobacter youngae TaxID=133448 RepID=UPI0039B67B1A